MLAIAGGINNVQNKWRAEVHGHRLAILPRFGNSASGTGYTLDGSPAAWDLNAAGEIFDGVAAQRAGETLLGGSDGFPPLLGEYNAAFEALRKIDLFNIMVLPRTHADPERRADIWGPASSFCLERRSFLLVDASLAADDHEAVLAELAALRIGVVKDHSGLYWPRLTISAGAGLTRDIDPSGSIAGLMGRIDSNRGVWKAPAGLEADIRGIRGVAIPLTDPQNGLLNPQAVNAIRLFPNGVVSWGARTMDGFDNSGNDDYKYVPVRRFALFIEESLFRGLKFAVFEPNDEPLWAQIRLAAGAFMNNLFRQGAFAGKTKDDAYFVKVDRETTTQNDINLGIVNVLVGFAPLKPAEFVVVTIQQKAGQVQV
jgi:phage tail sheath protein FI